jgi:predicted nuclease with TOPRIM domain
MFTTIIMMNIKNIFITTGISVLFGVYSIYNILEYLRILNNHRVKQINNLQHLVNETNTKYKNLQMKYHELSSNYEEINKEINLLNIKIAELQENKMKDTATNIDIYTNNSSYPENLTLNIICDELCNLNNEIPRVHMETMNSINDDIDEEFVESLYLDYESGVNSELSSLCNSEKGSIKSRSRSTSVTDINWGNLTKKFLFG